MCGRYGRDIPWSALHEALNLTRPEAAPNLEPEWDIRPTTPQYVARLTPDGLELARCDGGSSPSGMAERH